MSDSSAPSSKKEQLLALIRANPFISQQELGERLGLSRSAVAGHIASLTRERRLLGRAYVLPQQAPLVCIGGANLDRKLQSLGPLHLHSSNPARQSETPGGVARNIAENLARLGLPTRLLSAFGDDAAGHALLEQAAQLRIDTRGSLRANGAATGSYTAVLDADGELMLALAQMALIEQLTPEFLRLAAPQRADAALLVADLNLGAESIAFLIDEARQHGRPLVLVAVSVPKMERLPHDLSGAQCLILNEAELQALVGGQPLKSAATRRRALGALRARGLRQLVVTAGAAGVYCSSDDETKDLVHLPAEAVPVRDVSGAGDAFSAGVCASLHRDPQDLTLACRLGLRLAALTLQTEASVIAELSPALLQDPQDSR